MNISDTVEFAEAFVETQENMVVFSGPSVVGKAHFLTEIKFDVCHLSFPGLGFLEMPGRHGRVDPKTGQEQSIG